MRCTTVGLFGLVALAACGGDRVPTRKTIVDSRDNYDPRSLDPALSTDVPTGRAVAYVFDGLTRFTPDAAVQPALAERWDFKAGPQPVYTFHLRRGATFHDGTPLKAQHVVDSWQRALDPATKGGRAEPLQPILGARDFASGKARSVRGLRAADDTTLVVGTSVYAPTISANTVQTVSEVRGLFTVGASKALEIQHQCQATEATDGFGVAANFTTEVYTVVELWKVG